MPRCDVPATELSQWEQLLTRRAKMLQRRLERENARRAALRLDPIASIEELDDMDAPDVHLDQAAAIVTDLAELREIEATSTHTARNRR